ncbi:hypothetical protein Sjap_026283 [Stephania japonica]|uniref:Amine oxidase domain-containing protein n=1 Tax=Stephania japonica TaxID=461633 RepID=A0AAP0HID1_9MAGN
MDRAIPKVAVVGSGISGAVCASVLATNGVCVTVFESGRGPGGRMSQRKEIIEDGKKVFFDHGAPFFTIRDNDVMSLVCKWESRALVTQWKESFGCVDCVSRKFVDNEKEGTNKMFVGVPGMNSICGALCCEHGVEAKFGITVGKLNWLEDKHVWELIGFDGQNLGQFDGVAASDYYVVSPWFTDVTGKKPPLDVTSNPELALKLQEVSFVSCFALMLAFEEPLSSIPVRSFSFKNSDVLRWAFCDSSKPGRLSSSECWVLHSTEEYAKRVITQFGLRMPSVSLLSKVAEELLQEFQKTVLGIPQPIFIKAHRWDRAFPTSAVAREEKCLWDISKRLAICGDFCVSPDVEGAILSGMAAARNLLDCFNCL